MRLAKYIAYAGVASRRRAERLIESGRVAVDGRTVTDPALDVDDDSEVQVEGRTVAPQAFEYYLVNKPTGVVSTAHDPQGRPKVIDIVDTNARLYPVGRLDIGSSGLVLLTNDGELANRLMHPRYEVEKTYRVRVSGRPGQRALRALRGGVDIEDGRTTPARVRLLKSVANETVLELVVREGRKRQVRRMCEAVGHPVRALERVALGPLRLGRLAPRTARKLRPGEIEALYQVADLKPGAAGRPMRPRAASPDRQGILKDDAGSRAKNLSQ